MLQESAPISRLTTPPYQRYVKRGVVIARHSKNLRFCMIHGPSIVRIYAIMVLTNNNNNNNIYLFTAIGLLPGGSGFKCGEIILYIQ